MEVQDWSVDGDAVPEEDPFFRQEQLLHEGSDELPPQAPEVGTPQDEAPRDGTEQQR
jgi:hypothetical protein